MSIRAGQEAALVKLAADMSKRVYKDNPTAGPGEVFHKFFPDKPDMKPTLISCHNLGSEKILVVSIRGTTTLNHWLNNFNGKPVASSVRHSVVI
jgi:hypothetical protein